MMRTRRLVLAASMVVLPWIGLGAGSFASAHDAVSSCAMQVGDCVAADGTDGAHGTSVHPDGDAGAHGADNLGCLRRCAGGHGGSGGSGKGFGSGGDGGAGGDTVGCLSNCRGGDGGDGGTPG